MKLWPGAPSGGLQTPGRPFLVLLAVGLLATTITTSLIGTTTAYAQPRRPRGEPAAPATPKNDGKDGAAKDAASPSTPAAGGAKDGAGGAAAPKGGKPKVFDFTGIDLAGRLHTPQLLYFLERANEELERAFLERRSFIPHMVRSLDEEAL
jgi:hypothetical protein